MEAAAEQFRVEETDRKESERKAAGLHSLLTWHEGQMRIVGVCIVIDPAAGILGG